MRRRRGISTAGRPSPERSQGPLIKSAEALGVSRKFRPHLIPNDLLVRRGSSTPSGWQPSGLKVPLVPEEALQHSRIALREICILFCSRHIVVLKGFFGFVQV